MGLFERRGENLTACDDEAIDRTRLIPGLGLSVRKIVNLVRLLRVCAGKIHSWDWSSGKMSDRKWQSGDSQSPE